jgi:TRAP-type C4-dicarboxylate transport system substrate-binding protein
MAVGRRAILASAAASLATPALLRLARADAPLPHVTFKLHHAFSSVSCLHANFLAPWAHNIEEQSSGRIRIDLFPSMALGGQPAELFDQARDRIVDIVWAMPSDTPGRFPKIELFELPFVPPRRALVGSKAIEDFATDHLMDEFREVHPICFSCADRGVLHAHRPVRTVAEVKGLRLDVSTRFTAAAVAMLGGHPLPMPSGQLPLAIARHVVDGCIVPWDMVPALKLNNLLKAHTDFADDALSTTTAVLAMNKTAYEKLPAELKKVIDDNSGQLAASMAGTMWDLKAKAVADAVSQSGDIVVTLDPDAAARWRKAAQPVVDAWRKAIKARKADGDRLLTSARDLFEKYAGVPEPQPQPPAPPKPQVTTAQVGPKPPAKLDSPAPTPQPAMKAAPKPAPKVSVAAPPAHPGPSPAPPIHWWQFGKSTPTTASASAAPVTPPAAANTHWWQFWKPAATPAPVAASASATPVVPAAPVAVTVPSPATPAAAAIAKPTVPAVLFPAPPKPFDIPL